ncbi:MAG: hypothetical protein OXE99_12325 [Cellvibrionales bacterium]|nr:hypothetical protein [Cellvibrionales bacterium]
MKDHLSYAMQNEEATNALIYFNAPSQILDWSFLAIEAILVIGFILTIVHAFKYDKDHQTSSARLTLLAAFLYGLAMDIISYYTVENFWHGEFSVMFLYNRLPLYIALFYPTFMYHSYMLIRRFDFGPLKEAICVGFFAGFMYLIFDNLGPLLQWWVWDTSDTSTWPYVNSVPLTSYHWFFTFLMAFALINRIISWHWVEQKQSKIKIGILHALQPTLTILLGSVFFAPYNLLAAVMPPYDMLPWKPMLTLAAVWHGITFAAAGALFIFGWKHSKQAPDHLLMTFPFIFLVGHAMIYIAKFDQHFIEGGVNPLSGNLLAVLISLIGSSVIVLASNKKSA